MSIWGDSSHVAPTRNDIDLARITANFPPCVWGDYFIKYDSESTEVVDQTEEKIKLLKEEVRNMLVPASEKLSRPTTIINLIDIVQRLGLSYHFEHEIDEILKHIHYNYVENGIITLSEDLRSFALVFRLLRQGGYYVSPDIFKKFKDEQENFDEKLIMDVKGILSLYEAADLMIHGENILNEALAFTTTHLESIITKLSPSLATQVKDSLKKPLHRDIERLVARRYISIYQEDPSHNEIVLTLAKLDFNVVQKMLQKEVGNVSRWWKELDVANRLPYVRDRLIECCLWSFGVYHEPQYAEGRKLLMKLVIILSVVDDTYDAYGTIDELELFTKMIERWDYKCLDDLPQYMKFVYWLLLKLFEEIEQKLIKEGRKHILTYGIQEVKRLIQMYTTEARWLNRKYTPTTEEYMKVAAPSTAYPCLIITYYVVMGDIVTDEMLHWAINEPKIIKASSVITRLRDDIASNEFEQKREHVASFLECYMKQYGESRKNAIREGQKRIMDTWKVVNEECLKPTKVPMHFLKCPINLARLMDVFHQEDHDNYTKPEGFMKTCLESMLVHPVPI